MRGIISEENKTEMISFSYGAQNPEFKYSSAVTGRERERECVFSCTKGQSVHSVYESLVQTVLEEHS